MCQTSLISQNIAKLSTRGYRQNVDALAGEPLRVQKLKRLNNSLDALYHLLYNQFNTIKEEDYSRIGPQLHLLLSTVKDLYRTLRRLADTAAMKYQRKKLMLNYSALHEIDVDIRQFRLRPQPKALTDALTNAGTLLNAL